MAIVLTHWKLLFHLYQARCLLKIWNCCKNYFTTHGTTESCLPIYLLENHISFTIILNDLIFCKLDVIPNTIFSKHEVRTWNLENRWIMNFNCVLLTINCRQSSNLGIMTLGDVSTHTAHIIWEKLAKAFWKKNYHFA